MIGPDPVGAAPRGRPCNGGADDPCAPLVLSDGRRLGVHPLGPGDGPAEQDFVRGLSQLSRYRRFHVGWPEVPARYLARLVEVDQQQHVALAAWQLPKTRIVADARYVRDGDASVAEFAVAVADDHLRLGLATGLLQRLSRHARLQGIAWLRGDVLWDNEPMCALVERFGGCLKPRDDEPGVLLAWLPTGDPAQPALIPRPRPRWPGAMRGHRAASSPRTR